MKNLIDIASVILDNNSPKLEINHVLVDSKHVVSTDVRILICLPHQEVITDKYLVINPKAKCEFKDNESINGIVCNRIRAKEYPLYERILPKNHYFNELKHERFIYSLYQITYNTGTIFDYVQYASKFKKLDKLIGNNIIGWSQEYKNLPAALYLKDGGIIVLMPKVF